MAKHHCSWCTGLLWRQNPWAEKALAQRKDPRADSHPELLELWSFCHLACSLTYFIFVFRIKRRKFRSQTSDKMDRWKSRGGKCQRGEAKKWEEQRRVRVRRKKVQVRKKVVFPKNCRSGWSKSRLAKAHLDVKSVRNFGCWSFFDVQTSKKCRLTN